MRYKIFDNGSEINNIIADESFVTAYCAKHGYTYEADAQPEPQPTETGAEFSAESLAAAIREGVNAV